MSKFHFLNKKLGFTLIELLVVTVIIGILVGVAFTIVSPVRAKARDVKRLTDLRQIEKALLMYNMDNEKYPLSTSEYEIEGAPWGKPWPRYIDPVPKDPLPTQRYLYDSDGFSYQLYARFEREGDINPIFLCVFSCGEDGEYNGGVASAGSLLVAWGETGPSLPPTGGLPSGKQTYYISSSAEVRPRFIQVTIDPLDVKVGDTQVLTTKVWSETPIVSVTTVTELDTQIMNLDLIEIGKDETGTTFSNSWKVFDTHVKTYHTKFIATDEAGNKNSITLAWSDPCAGITQGQNSTLAAGCTVDGISGLDGGNLTIAANLVLNANSTWVFNPGKSITISKSPAGSIAVNGQIKKSCLYYTDVDGDTYTPSFTMTENSGCGTISQKVRVMSAGSQSLADCYEADPATTNAELAHPGQTNYYTTNRGDTSFDYDCNGTADKQYTTYKSACNTDSSGACNVVPPGPCTGSLCSTTSTATPACGGTYTVYLTTDGGNCNACLAGSLCTQGSCTVPYGTCGWRNSPGAASCGGTSKTLACR